jgi:hypothetical protein
MGSLVRVQQSRNYCGVRLTESHYVKEEALTAAKESPEHAAEWDAFWKRLGEALREQTPK